MSQPSDTRRVVLASFIGTTIEWYDFFLYVTASALVFGKLFFTTMDPLAATMASFATNAVGFFARPLGGIVFGHFGDKIGRKSMLVTTLMMMGLATFGIGLLPTYDQAGILAPVLLVLLRFVQGLGVGGEWGGAVLMAVEHGKAGQRGFLASWVQAGVPIGLLIATGVFRTLSSIIPEPSFMAWGWRIPFLIGILLLGVGMFIRLRVLESPVFAEAKKHNATAEMPIFEVIRRYPRNVLIAMGARFAENAFFYVITAFVLTYATQQAGFTKDQVLQAVLVGSAVQFFVIPIFGWLSDRVGRRPVYLGGTLLVVLFAFPFFWLVDLKTTGMLWLAVTLGLIIHSTMYGPQAAFFSELFGTRVRYSGASLGYQLASPLAGGLAPLIATALLDQSGGKPWPVAVYLIFMAVITLISVWLAEETNRKAL
ncbi:MAG: MHS family MFS transporter [Prosthecobacter sp.]|jgi:MHS family shikimate/dehydroshikimate transporter-like MFS transporter|uniref:MFS transporter n=1 Tax=Prosthecobacter sp. TaxID=1965333 RepID=UPI0019F6A359|nr:MFS transporter [Prosthecobacter sp.]MBE2286946.1 MHS family MFS transporter [Prosthecobacter sp.]